MDFGHYVKKMHAVIGSSIRLERRVAESTAKHHVANSKHDFFIF